MWGGCASMRIREDILRHTGAIPAIPSRPTYQTSVNQEGGRHLNTIYVNSTFLMKSLLTATFIVHITPSPKLLISLSLLYFFNLFMSLFSFCHTR